MHALESRFFDRASMVLATTLLVLSVMGFVSSIGLTLS
jgi:hypothetical protein